MGGKAINTCAGAAELREQLKQRKKNKEQLTKIEEDFRILSNNYICGQKMLEYTMNDPQFVHFINSFYDNYIKNNPLSLIEKAEKAFGAPKAALETYLFNKINGN